MTQPESTHPVLAATVAEHRDQLEAYAGSEKETAELADALLEWTRASAVLDGVKSE